MNLLEDLTPSQAAAVTHVEGPLLVLAGPGSGKTRVVTRRIAHLVASGVSPREIVAITFTNKAAGEMQERVEQLLPGAKVWVSTFHRFCVRLLRRYAGLVGLQSNFTILDTSDQKQLVRRVMGELDFDTVHFSPDKVLWQISDAKNDLVTPQQYRQKFEESVGNYQQSIVAQVYPEYQRALLSSNAVDFDDLLMHLAVLLDESDEVREQLDDRYRYILVDEYQDTNLAQYRIAAGLSQRNRNLCVTGDPDQSIYGWRGARIENILRFERDFPGAKVVRLEENFRSTGAILRSADQLISRNTRRKSKRLFSSLGEGAPVRLWQFPTAEQEAEGIARAIRAAVRRPSRRYDDFAVVYRINALSRLLELALRRYRVPYQVAAGFEFYERAEVKDLLAYLRLVHNPADRAAFLRVVNTPLRSLGKTSQDRLTRWADEQGITCLEAAARPGNVPKLSRQARAGFQRFAEMMQSFSLADSGSVEALMLKVIDKTRLAAAWEGSPSEEDQQRLANVNELVTAARSFDAIYGAETSLEGFLEQTSLVSDTDSVDSTAGKVTLLTLHAAKGLEFPVVYIVGLEQGLLPHERSTSGDADPHDLEEERRLLFVGMTRAERELHLTMSQRRSIRGQERYTIPSLFLHELEAELALAPGSGDVPVDPYSGIDVEAEAVEEPPQSLTSAARPADVALTPGDLRSRLMTGADLLNGGRSAVELPTGFAVGSRVRHPRYGLGVVTTVSGYGPKRTVTVRFEDDQEKSFVAAQSPLQPAGIG